MFGVMHCFMYYPQPMMDSIANTPTQTCIYCILLSIVETTLRVAVIIITRRMLSIMGEREQACGDLVE